VSELKVIARFAIHGGKLEEFKAVAAGCMESVREKDSGTEQYDWFFNEDRSKCVVLETYASSDAILKHITNLGDLMGQLLGAADMELDIFGEPSAELVEAAAGLAPKIYSPFQTI